MREVQLAILDERTKRHDEEIKEIKVAMKESNVKLDAMISLLGRIFWAMFGALVLVILGEFGLLETIKTFL